MADKEATVFVVDLAPTLTGEECGYLFDTIATKLMKGLKTDYISVVAFHSSGTRHALAETGKFRGINVLVDFETPSYKQLQQLKKELVPNKDQIPECSDGFQALVFSVSLFEQTRKKAFKRNIVVITSSDSPMKSFSESKAAALPNLIKDLALNLVVIGADFNSSKPSTVERDWDLIAQQFDQGHILSVKEASKLSTYFPAVKKTRPMPTYRGDLRFGSDFSKIVNDKNYDPSEDDSCLVWQVEVYPAAKSDILSRNLHDYIVDGDKVVRVERITKPYVWEKDFQNIGELFDDENADDRKCDKIFLADEDTVPGFKFSNFDLLALDSDLRDASRLEISSDFDIFGFLKISSIPYSYFTDEASFVVPEKSSSFKNTLTHFAFCQALYKQRIAAIARLVRKQAKEIEIGAMVPVKVKEGSEFSYCYIFIRLPFKEDEKIGNFPRLAEKTEEIQRAKISTEAQSAVSKTDELMDEFVNAWTLADTEDLGEPEDYKTTINNYKVTMKGSDSSKLNLPTSVKNTDPFICNSFGSNKYSNYLKKALLKSLEVSDWTRFCQEPKFVELALKESKDATNFMNLENALIVNSNACLNWLKEMSLGSQVTGKRLIKELDIKYLRKVDLKKKKVTKNEAIYEQKGNYGADEGNYGSVPDFGF